MTLGFLSSPANLGADPELGGNTPRQNGLPAVWEGASPWGVLACGWEMGLTVPLSCSQPCQPIRGRTRGRVWLGVSDVAVKL